MHLPLLLFFLLLQMDLLSSEIAVRGGGDQWIVVTTIHYPSSAVRKLVALRDWHLVVVGDRKNPKDWQIDNCECLSIEKPQTPGYEIIKFLPENHDCRKNIGNLYAISKGAFKDFCNEQDLYLKSGNLIEFLLNRDSQTHSFTDRIFALIRNLSQAIYIKSEEIAFSKAWINDFTKLGYRFPSFKKWELSR